MSNILTLINVSQETNKLIAKDFNAETAARLIESEQALAAQCDLVVTHCMTPALIDSFGEQHVEAIVTEAYQDMLEYELSQDVMEKVVETLLKVRRPEEISHNPERVRNFLDAFLSGGLYIPDLTDDEVSALLADLTDGEIREMSATDYDPESSYEEEDEED